MYLLSRTLGRVNADLSHHWWAQDASHAPQFLMVSEQWITVLLLYFLFQLASLAPQFRWYPCGIHGDTQLSGSCTNMKRYKAKLMCHRYGVELVQEWAHTKVITHGVYASEIELVRRAKSTEKESLHHMRLCGDDGTVLWLGASNEIV